MQYCLWSSHAQTSYSASEKYFRIFFHIVGFDWDFKFLHLVEFPGSKVLYMEQNLIFHFAYGSNLLNLDSALY